MLDSTILYFSIIRLKIQAQMQYKTNFIIGYINQFAVVFFEFLGTWALLTRFGQIDGWTVNQVFLTYGIVNLSYSVAEVTMRGFESNMIQLVRKGDYDRYLLRPRNTIIQISAFNFQLARAGRAMVAIIVLIISIYLNIEYIVGLKWIILALSVVCGICLYVAIYIGIGIISFKLQQNVELTGVFIQGSVSTMQYPKTIFPKWVQFIFTFLIPVTTITYYPIAAIFNKSTSIPPIVSYLIPLTCILLLIVVIKTFYRIEKKYVSTGT